MSFGLGRHVEHDERSRGFSFMATPKKPATVLWDHVVPVLDQGNLGSCTGNALAQWLNVTSNRAKRPGKPVLDEKGAVQLYSVATQVDGIPGHYPPEDTGSSGLAVCKAGKRLGFLTSYRHAFSFSSFQSAMQSSPVIVGSAWHEGMFTPDANGFLSLTGAVAGGHEYLVLGMDTVNQHVTILNSWSDSWGQHGRAHIRFDDFRALLADQGDVTVPII